jgi:uncharacterized RDD family membrane protein YckC
MLATLTRRSVALSLDNIALWILGFFQGSDFGPIITSLLMTFVVQFLFYKFKGASFGKWCVGIRPVDATTFEILGPWRGTLRDTLGHPISGLILGIGYIVAFFNKDKQTVHDMIFKTVVVRVGSSSVDTVSHPSRSPSRLQ